MRVATRRATLALLGAALLLTGCLGASPAEETPSGQSLPNEGGPSAGGGTDPTRPGPGGQAHTHDLWAGRDRVVILSRDVSLARFSPIFPGGPGSLPEGGADVKLPPPALVYEGTVQVELEAKDPKYNVAEDPFVVPAPREPRLRVQIRTAADAQFVDAGTLSFREPLVLAVRPDQTDMPHSAASLWAFRFVSDAGEVATFNLTVTLVRGAGVPEWPGHPDLYAGALERVVLDRAVTVKDDGYVQERILYGDAAPAWVAPDGLVGDGTATLTVLVKVKRFETAGQTAPHGFYLNHHNATDLGTENKEWPRVNSTTPEADTHVFEIPVTPDGMDGPYQPSSRWGFAFVPEFIPGKQALGIFTPYELEYSIQVVARASPGAEGAVS